MQKKILVALDGSVHSNNVLRYIDLIFKDLPDIHLHLLSIVPTSALPAGREWMHEGDIMNSLSKEAGNKYRFRQKYLQQAVKQLAQSGIQEDHITTSVQLSRMAVAKDILNLARKGLYDAILLGRRGLSKLEELMIGSVSSELVGKSHDVPLWVLAGRVRSNKFLVPVDGSFHCLKAIDHLSHILKGNPHAEVTLFHSSAMMASDPDVSPMDFYDQWGQKWCEEHLGRPDSLFHAPKQMLIDNDFPENKIYWLHTFKGIYPSRQILRQAMIDNFGTIVLGRRGEEEKKGFFKGVSDQVLLMAEDMAVWILG